MCVIRTTLIDKTTCLVGLLANIKEVVFVMMYGSQPPGANQYVVHLDLTVKGIHLCWLAF